MFEARYYPREGQYFMCNGDWHDIQGNIGLSLGILLLYNFTNHLNDRKIKNNSKYLNITTFNWYYDFVTHAKFAFANV